MSFAEDINQRFRAQARLRARILRELAEREPPPGSENQGPTSGVLNVALPRELVARLQALGERMGHRRGVRGTASVLLGIALEQTEPLFAPGPSKPSSNGGAT